MRNSTFCMHENKGTDHDHTFVFTIWIVEFKFIYFIYPKFLASTHFLCLYSLVCVGPGRKPQGWFSHDRTRSFWYFCQCPPLNHSSISGNTRSRSHVSGQGHIYNLEGEGQSEYLSFLRQQYIPIAADMAIIWKYVKETFQQQSNKQTT